MGVCNFFDPPPPPPPPPCPPPPPPPSSPPPPPPPTSPPPSPPPPYPPSSPPSPSSRSPPSPLSCSPPPSPPSPPTSPPTSPPPPPPPLSFNKIAVQRINYVRKCLVQVTSTRTTAYSSTHHSVVLTADKNITWFLQQRVKMCSGRSWLRIRTSSRLLNTEVNEI